MADLGDTLYLVEELILVTNQHDIDEMEKPYLHFIKRHSLAGKTSGLQKGKRKSATINTSTLDPNLRDATPHPEPSLKVPKYP